MVLSPALTSASESEGELAAFLSRSGWAGTVPVKIAEDGAARSYYRLEENGRTAVLMKNNNAVATPGHNINDFIRIGTFLRHAGLHTPAVEAADEARGFLLLEDFGDTSFKKAMEQGTDRQDLYALAVSVLTHIRTNVDADGLSLPNYYDSHVHKGLRRLVDWYVPAIRQSRNDGGLAEEYLAVWKEIESGLPACPQGFLHIDFHVENLMWLPGARGMDRCGILDFQGAMRGPLPYDLANLLEDARVAVPETLRREMLENYTSGMDAADRELFMNWYRILATQFHCRVAGQFIRLAVRDNKTRYLQFMPIVLSYLEEGLRHPVLRPLKEWLRQQDIDFNGTIAIDPARVRSVIRDDAF